MALDFSSISSGIFGDSSNAGVLGVGQYKGKAVDINQKPFTDTTESDRRQREFASALAKVQGRRPETMKAAQIGPASTMNAATINTMPQGEFRSGQTRLVSSLEDQAAGRGPSLADMQLNRAREGNIASAMALTSSQRGLSVGQGLRQIAQQIAGANADASRASAQARIQEQMIAREQLANALASARGADIGLASSQAQLDQQAGMQNQEAVNQFALQQALLAQQAAANNQQTSLANRGLNDQMARFYNTGLADMDTREREAAMALEQLRVQQQSGLNQVNQAAYEGAGKRRGDFISNSGESIATAVAAMSDRNVKTEINDGKAEARDFLSALKAHTYHYKDSKHGEGLHLSPMAQDIEKTKIGKSLVFDTPEGKAVNYAKAGGVMLASAAMLNERLDDLESEFAKALKNKRRAA